MKKIEKTLKLQNEALEQEKDDLRIKETQLEIKMRWLQLIEALNSDPTIIQFIGLDEMMFFEVKLNKRLTSDMSHIFMTNYLNHYLEEDKQIWEFKITKKTLDLIKEIKEKGTVWGINIQCSDRTNSFIGIHKELLIYLINISFHRVLSH